MYEYKVIPAPTKGQKGKGIKGAEARFANAVEAMMNDMAAEGWEYQRAETLPSIERAGLTSSTTEWRNLLVFRKLIIEDPQPEPEPRPEPELLPPPMDQPQEVPAEDIAVETPEETDKKPEER